MKPLDGILVIDLTRVLAGPFASMMLGDMGADVIKVETPSGDDSRTYGPPFIEGESTYFLSVNRNKKSMILDLRTPEALDILTKLIIQADVLLENFRPGTMEKMNLGYEACHKLNPKLVYASISGFGKSGSFHTKAAFDLAIQGMSGMMDITGDPDGPPLKVGTSIADVVGGIYAAFGITLALLARIKTDQGQLVDTALLDGQLSLLTYQASMYINSGINPRRKANVHPSIAPYETFQASDSYINIAAGSQKLWLALCDVIHRPELKDDQRFLTNADRVRNRAELYDIINDIIKTKPYIAWIEGFDKAGIPAAPIFSVEEILSHSQTLQREMVVDMKHPTVGDIKVPGIPIKLSATPGDIRIPPPLHGEHTEEILKKYLHLSDEEIAKLRERKIITPKSNNDSTND
jgi:crotonobetainyl-CoA:carnitine CoA-transferase CaiB-like acyl-CoA transferase